MANLTATSAWSDVLQLETTHQAIGGAGGTMNLQAQSLINRTQYLADNKFNTADFLTTLKTNLNASGSAPIYACRAWVNFNGTGTVAIRASGNVSSITDAGVGLYDVNLTTAMPDVNYNTLVNLATTGLTLTNAENDTSAHTGQQTVSSVRVISQNYAEGYLDFSQICVSIFR